MRYLRLLRLLAHGENNTREVFFAESCVELAPCASCISVPDAYNGNSDP